MIVTDRQDHITKLKDLLYGSIGPNAENLVEDVYDYVPETAGGLSPLVALGPVGSLPGQSTPGRASDEHTVAVWIFVVYAHAERSVDERDAWVTLNQIRTSIVKTVLLNKRVEGLWSSTSFPEASRITVMKMDDQGYLAEVMPVLLRQF